jgi:hypothetical protein
VIYRAYGLTLDSAICISALTPTSAVSIEPTIRFEAGATPDWVSEALSLPAKIVVTRRLHERGPGSEFSFSDYGNGRFFQLRYSDGTRFVVDHDATRVWGENGPGLTNEDLSAYLLGPVMGFVLRRRGRIPLHASAVAFGDRAAALMGPVGAGKSTTAAALALRGRPVLCEDICALYPSDGALSVFPGYPRICLWPDSVNHLFSSPEALPLIVQGWNKRYLPLDGSRAQFASTPLPLSAIYVLAQRTDRVHCASIKELSRKDAALQLVQNTYMNWLLDSQQRAVEFDVIAEIASKVRCFEVTASSKPDRLAGLAALIESHAVHYFDVGTLIDLGSSAGNV